MSGEPVVVHVVVAGEVGGAERMLVDLTRGDTGARHVVALVTPSERLRALFQDAGLDLEDRGVVREGPLAYLARSLGPGDVAWLERVLRWRGAAAVHLHTFGSQVLGTRAALRLSLPLVRTEHSTRVYEDPSCWPFSRWSLGHADAVVCISEHVRAVAAARAPWAAARMRVVPNGVDVARFAPLPLADPTRGPLRFLALGRLEPRKGLDQAIEAVARVPGVVLTVVGDGQERRSLETLAAERGVGDRVTFAGYAEDVRQAIADAHVLLSSARAEGLGIALLEGMAMGRAVVALPTGGVPEIVVQGETGWLADGTSIDALARAMADAEAHRADIPRRGHAARARVSRSYDLTAMRAGYARVYRDVIRR